eukprot:CAMPEP_0197657232 /NCGR_PEP_ID=MMETSP1338-20131121/44505_1 /TAXON_ID=43686 ORGANISM="Pelagodinium beii, Strain RCC1491" /NCGR_SAMPLE_ID=MMETSP1338 /ASSEMBLY_ACC=CAM_ASM_000754 /LENGTH=1444 /DNA_ID=CAMNT_0043233561 /DNA_START=73 /DNA_END=4407 /DNA_ORIENTATION=+
MSLDEDEAPDVEGDPESPTVGAMMPQEDVIDMQGMAYTRHTTAYTRLNAAMVDMRTTKMEATEREHSVDPGFRARSSPADAVRMLLAARHSSIVRGWRSSMDVRGVHGVMANDFYTVLRKLGFTGDVRTAWDELGGNARGKVTLADLDADSAEVLGNFFRGFSETIGNILRLVEGTDSRRVGRELFVERCKQVKQSSDAANVDLNVAFQCLSLESGAVTEEDCLWLEYFVTRKQRPPPKTERQIEFEERTQVLQQEKKAHARRRAVDDFKTLLRHQYGSVIAGWRKVLDKDNTGEVPFEAFEEGVEELEFTGDKDGIWEELVEEEEEFLVLERLEPLVEKAQASFVKSAVDAFGSVEKCFSAMAFESRPLVTEQEFNVMCTEINMKENRRVLFELLDKKGVGTISLSEIDAEAAYNSFGKIACDVAEERLKKLEKPSKAHKTLYNRAVEQCGATRRDPETLPSAREALVALLQEKFETTVRAWANALDPNAKGKIKRKEFLTGISSLGYAGNTTKLWEEMDLKPKSNIRFKDLCPETVEEIKEFKMMAGKKIIGLIQGAEAAAGPGKSKKAGVPVSNDEFFKLLETIDYQGDAEMLLKHLDPANVGYVNTRTLRILNEQKSEEKAIPQYLKKSREAAKTQLEQKIEAVKVPPKKELLAKQDKILQTSRDDRKTRMDKKAAREEFMKGIIGKFGSVAKAWRLALDPENAKNIENSDRLIKALKRAGQVPEEGGESALRKKAEFLFDVLAPPQTGVITLEDLDPLTPALMEKFKDQAELRFGSLQEAFEHYDPEGTGSISKKDFLHLCQSAQIIDGIYRLVEFLDPKGNNVIQLKLIDAEVTQDLKKHVEAKKEAEEAKKEYYKKKGSEHMLLKAKPFGVACGPDHAREERAKKPAQQTIAELKRRLLKKHRSLVRAWRVVHGNIRKELGSDSFKKFFEEVDLDNSGSKAAFEMLVPPQGKKQKLLLKEFDPGIAADLEDLKQKIAERYTSSIAMFKEVDEDGSMLIDHNKFLELCYECKFKGNEHRLFEYLDRKDEKLADMKDIDEEAYKKLKAQRAEQEAKRQEAIKKAKEAKKKAARAARRKERGDEFADSDEDSEADKEDEEGEEGEKPEKEKKEGNTESKSSPSSPSKAKKGKPGKPATPELPPQTPSLAENFRVLLERRFGGSLVKAWKAIDTHGHNVLNKNEFIKAVGSTGYAGNPSALWTSLLEGSQETQISMREIDVKQFRHMAAFRRACKRSLDNFEKAFADESGQPGNVLDENAFMELCKKVGAPKPWPRLFAQFAVKSADGVSWDDVSWLEENWNWQGTKETPIRGFARLGDFHGQLPGSPPRTSGTGHLCFSMRPRQVSLKKTSSLPSLKIGIRAQWNDRWHIHETIGNRDMNLIHLYTKVQTQEQEKTDQRCRKKLIETSTIQWLEEQVVGEEDSNDLLGSTEEVPDEEEEP